MQKRLKKAKIVVHTEEKTEHTTENICEARPVKTILYYLC